jgi:predicted transcriptional regulator
LKQELLRVLKGMNEATGHVDFSEFSNMVNLQPNETMTVLRELAKTGHLRKVGSGYALTEKGKTAFKALIPVPAGEKFEFYLEIGRPAGNSAATPIEFYEIIKEISTTSLEFHVCRKDFEMWARKTLDNAAFAQALAGIDEVGLLGEELRNAITKAFELTYNLR